MNLPILVTRGVLHHLEHGACDLVLLLEFRQALVGVLVHGSELPHAEGGQAAVGVSLTDTDLAVERIAFAFQADGRGQHQAGDRDDDEHGTAEHDIEHPLDGPVGQSRAVPVHDGSHGLVAAGALAPVHGLSNQRRPHGRFTLYYFFSSHSQTYVPVPQGSPNR